MELLEGAWPYVIAVIDGLVAATASAHVILRKRDVRAAIGWTGLIWLVPIGGALLYLVFGVNRIRRRGARIQAEMAFLSQSRAAALPSPVEHLPFADVSESEEGLARAVGRLTGLPLAPGNRVEALADGDEAFPAMLEAIRTAASTVVLQTYIFDVDSVGREFLDALEAAHRRGVAVRVLIDAVGALYGRPSVTRELRRRGVPVATFLGDLMPWRMPFLNLRNHRKLLVIDGRTGFTGGLNIRARHLRATPPGRAVRDLHFRLAGPVVRHLAETFAKDWVFTTGETLYSPGWFPHLEPVGAVVARGIADGPDEEVDRLHATYLAALAGADRSVRIVTPYFLPDPALMAGLATAALRGVEVDVVLPRRNNLRVVGWAMQAQLGQVLDAGCRVWLTPPPFDHSKLMLVDGRWALFGSGNWDPRSFRLNFELDVEAYDAELGDQLERMTRERIAIAAPLTRKELHARPLPSRLRDGIAWLASPYL
ncbi:MAG: cardiolipin synthase [Gemmatimonadota bacterium]|nr:cardiolipin synthase [Gemmatimonadota bacterium]